LTLEEFLLVSSCTVFAATGILGAAQVNGAAPAPRPASIEVVSGMPPVVDPSNVYSETGPNDLSPAVRGDLERIYVPDLRSDDVSVIDPATLKVVDRIKVGHGPQHVVPSYDLRTLWVTNNAERRTDGSLTPIDPRTGKPGKSIPVDDPYNMYFTPDGRSAIVVAEALRRLDFRDPHAMTLQYSIDTPRCGGVNHADFSIDGRYAIFTCEFDGSLAKRCVAGSTRLAKRRGRKTPNSRLGSSGICAPRRPAIRNPSMRRKAGSGILRARRRGASIGAARRSGRCGEYVTGPVEFVTG